MFRRLLIGGILLMAATGSASASDIVLTPPMPIDGLATEVTAAIKLGKVALPSIELSACEEPFWYKCHYQLGHAVKIVVSGPERSRPATGIWTIVSDDRDIRTYILLVDFFMTRFDEFSIDQRANLIESAAADFEAGRKEVKIEGERAIVTLERRNASELWITVVGR